MDETRQSSLQGYEAYALSTYFIIPTLQPAYQPPAATQSRNIRSFHQPQVQDPAFLSIQQEA